MTGRERRKGGGIVIKRKYVVLSLLTLASIMMGSLLYSNLVSAQSSTVTGYVSVPAAAFVRMESTDNILIYLSLANEDTSRLFIFGEVQLPHGATVTNMTSYWYDAGPMHIRCDLCGYSQSHIRYMAWASSSGNTGLGSSYDDTINYATIDNSQYAYLLWLELPERTTNNYYFDYAVIEYTLPVAGAVGGMWIPVDKFSLLAPYIALVATIVLAISTSLAYIKIRKKQ